METRSYSFDTFFYEVVFGWKCIDTTDGEIYYNEEEVWKVFSSCFPEYRKNENNLESVSRLDPDMFTPPLVKLYLDKEYYGFKMGNAGVSLYEYIKRNNPKMDEKIYILNRVKEIISFLNRQDIQHGDIRVQNIMVDTRKNPTPHIRLGDVNNMIFPSTEYCYLNRLHDYWMIYYGTVDYIDKLAFDLVSHILLNFNNEDIINIAKKPILIKEARILLEEGNRCFRDDAYTAAKHDIICKDTCKKRALKDTYLIDCLK